MDLVTEHGADNVTIPAVARAAGVNPTTVYRRWGTVSALLADIARQRQETEAPRPTGNLRADLENQAAWTLVDVKPRVAVFRNASAETSEVELETSTTAPKAPSARPVAGRSPPRRPCGGSANPRKWRPR